MLRNTHMIDYMTPHTFDPHTRSTHFIHTYICISTSTYMCDRPTQSMIYVPSLVNISENYFTYPSVQIFKILFRNFILQYLILRKRSCGTGFITQSSWVLHLRPTIMVGRKYFVPPRYQLQRVISGGPALKYFCIIHRVGRIICVHYMCRSYA